MVEADRSCDEVVTQLLAVRAAIDRVGLLVLSRQVDLCLGEDGDPRSMETLRTALRHITRLGTSAVDGDADG
jgi:DNA-binding FrmR family transcriptional regulator